MARTRLYPPSVDPGFPELPSTPAGWKRAKFGDLLEVVSRPIKLEPGAIYRLVNAKRSRGGIALRAEVLGREVLTKTQFETKAGDFLISRRQIIHGACGVVPADLDGAVVSNEYSTLRTRPALLMDFLRQYSHTPYFQRTCFHSSHGVDVEKMIFKLGEWLAREVDVPPLAEQRKIGAILSAADEVIENTDAVVKSLQALKNAMMQELLTRGLPGRHTRFKQTELGEVPHEWEVATIGSVGAVFTGNTPSPARAEYWRGHNLFVTPGDLGSRRVIRETGRRLTDAGLAAGRLLPAGAVLVTCIGSSIGKVGILGATGCSNQQINAVVCDPDEAHPDYLFFVLLHQRDQILANASQTAVPIINKSRFSQVKLPLPPLPEQAAIAAALTSVEDRVDTEREATGRAAALKAALMAVLLTGELRVTPDEGVA